jgi:hypothetical protein
LNHWIQQGFYVISKTTIMNLVDFWHLWLVHVNKDRLKEIQGLAHGNWLFQWKVYWFCAHHASKESKIKWNSLKKVVPNPWDFLIKFIIIYVGFYKPVLTHVVDIPSLLWMIFQNILLSSLWNKSSKLSKQISYFQRFFLKRKKIARSNV